MRTSLAFVLVGVLGCTASSPSAAERTAPVNPSQPEAEPESEPEAEPEAEPVEPEVEAAAISVQMIAATLADECGGGPNTPPKAVPKAKAKKDEAPPARAKSKAKRARRRCRQSSMQLAIAAPAGIQPAQLAVKSVELSIEQGAALGLLEARAPSIWSEADGYVPWDQRIEPEQDLSVSYALTEPDWSKVEDRRSKTYTVKAVISIAGDDRTLEQNVEVAMPTSLPPGVKT